MASSAVSLQQYNRQQQQQDGLPSFLPQLRLCLYSLLIRNGSASEYAGIERTWLNLNSLLMAVSARAAIVDVDHGEHRTPSSARSVDNHALLARVNGLLASGTAP